MAYQSLYRRYRPQRFAEVRGQDHLVRALKNAVVEGRVGHAYLFSGPRGTGKTSTARILAKVLNCEAPVDGEPCGECASCQAIEHGSSFDVHELDAASNNGVEAVRDLINKAALGSPGRTKVYILDEVHMLSAAASNALLKTLEEPPDHVVFVLATTDPQKVLPTIRSRTQHFEVHLLPAADLEALVDDVIADAGLDVSPEAREHVLRVGGGSARDTLSALDQVVAAGGVPDEVSSLDELIEALCDKDTARALMAVEEATSRGAGPRVLGEHLIARLRDIFLASVGADLARLSERDRERAEEQARRLGPAGSTRALEVIGEVFVGIQDAPDPRVPLEVALVRLTKPEAEHTMEAIVERLERLERGLGPIGSTPAAVEHVAHRPATPSAPPAAADAEASGPVAEPAAAPSSGPGEDAGPGGPASAARRELAKKRTTGGGGVPRRAPASARGGAPARPAAPQSNAAPAATATAPTPSASAPPAPAEAEPAPAAADAPAPAPPAPAAPAGSGTMPSRDDLTLAWGDHVLAGLSQRARVRFAGGRFVSVDDGVARFGLPNAHHVARCEEVRAEVEAALGAHFGVPVRLQIVVDDDAPPPPAPIDAPRPVAASTPEEEEAVDVSELVDADDVASSTVDRIATVFPGAELVEEA